MGKGSAEVAFLQISPRGQITLPAAVRKLVGIEGGDPVAVSVKDGAIILTPVAITPIERYTEERIKEFETAADMTAAELEQARAKWNR